MADTHTKHGHAPEENPAVSYERSDLDTFAVGKFGIGLAVGTLAAVLMMWGLFRFFESYHTEGVEELPASVVKARQDLIPPEPRLQTMGNPQAPDVTTGALRSPRVELHKLREDEARQLQMYAWVDPSKGTIRIPIDVAKDLVLKKGLPTKVTPEGQVRAATPNPGESVGDSAAAQPQTVYATGAAALGSEPITKLPEAEETPVTEPKK
jgi:hypothetical protein